MSVPNEETYDKKDIPEVATSYFAIVSDIPSSRSTFHNVLYLFNNVKVIISVNFSNNFSTSPATNRIRDTPASLFDINSNTLKLQLS